MIRAQLAALLREHVSLIVLLSDGRLMALASNPAGWHRADVMERDRIAIVLGCYRGKADRVAALVAEDSAFVNTGTTAKPTGDAEARAVKRGRSILRVKRAEAVS
jgi:hypothetical protein